MRVINIETRHSETSDWKRVFSQDRDITPSYYQHYLDINTELGWMKYSLVAV